MQNLPESSITSHKYWHYQKCNLSWCWVEILNLYSILYRKGGRSMIKKTVAKVIAKASEKMAKAACGSASHFGLHQCKEPAKLSKSSK